MCRTEGRRLETEEVVRYFSVHGVSVCVQLLNGEIHLSCRILCAEPVYLWTSGAEIGPRLVVHRNERGNKHNSEAMSMLARLSM